MKRLAMFLGGLIVLPAFAEVAPVFYDEPIEYSDTEYGDAEYVDEEEMDAVEPAKAPVKISRQPATSRTSANRGTTSRAAPAASGATSARGKSTGNSSRVVASRTATTASPRTASSRAVATRTATTGAATGAATRAAANRATPAGTARTATTGRTVARTGAATSARAATSSARVLTTSDDTLYNPNGARVSIRGNGTTGTMSRNPTIRVASVNSDSTSIVSDTSDMDELAELTDYCKAQYAACMDNYCNVLDDNQGRCSCSANLKNYAKSEAALKQATEELQEVAQKFQYIGLTSREVDTLFSQTEAELSMQSRTDTSQLKTSLDKIKSMIVDVKSGTASSSATGGLSFDLSGLLDFSIDSTGFDLSSFLGDFSNSNSGVSNQRGEELFKTATNRCKASVLRACTAQGVDATLVTNAYDLEIDKECIAYERSLKESNDQMAATVRNANSVLQRARLLVQQSKNEYSNMRECISALDNCMQDEFVCGSDYENCLDPTGRYIVNGAIVVGSQPGHAIDPANYTQSSLMTSDVCRVNLYRTWDITEGTCSAADVYDSPSDQGNAWGAGPNDTLANYISQTVSLASAKSASVNMSKYLQNKIGYVEDDKNYGMCISVLNKCQDFTYNGTGTNAKYNGSNEVIKQYLNRALVQIKAKQDQILADYAESCITDVSTCLAKNNYPSDEPVIIGENNTTETWTNAQRTAANIAINACRPTIVTCMSVNGYSVDNPTPKEMSCWVMGLQFNTVTEECESVYDSFEDGGSGGGSKYSVTINCSLNCGADPATSYITGLSAGATRSLANYCTSGGRSVSSWSCNNGATVSGTTVTIGNQSATCTAACTTAPSNKPTITWNTGRGSIEISGDTTNCPSNYTVKDSAQNVTCNKTVGGEAVTGWTENSDGTTNCSSTTTVTIPANTSKNLNYYACFASKSGETFTVSYSYNGGSCTTASSATGSTSSPVTLPAKANCSKTNYTLSGWKCGSSSTVLDPGASYGPTADVTCTAQWAADAPSSYTVTYDCNGGSGSPASVTVAAGNAVTLLNSGCTLTGYTMSGWACGTFSRHYSLGASYTPTESVTCRVEWTEDSEENGTGDDNSGRVPVESEETEEVDSNNNYD